MRAPSSRRTTLPILAVTVMLIAAACSGGADISPPETSALSSGDTTQPDVSTAPSGPTPALDPAIVERAWSVYQIPTSGDGQLGVAIECDPPTGDNLIYAGASGFPEGIYVGTVDPSIGGSVRFQVGADGTGLGSRQATIDQATYTVTFADIDGGIELTLEGCTG